MMNLRDPKHATMESQAWAAAAILGLGLKFDSKDVEAAYRRTSRTVHPDVCHGPEGKRLFRLATQAREFLLKVLAAHSRPAPVPQPGFTIYYRDWPFRGATDLHWPSGLVLRRGLVANFYVNKQSDNEE